MVKQRKSEIAVLKEYRKPLTSQERQEVMSKEAVWHHGPKGEPTPAVWKSEHPTKGIVYVTNTHRVYQTAPTVKGAISKYHKVVKGTA